MKYHELGRSGIKVSEICLGTMTWGSQNSEAEAHEQMDVALELGVNFWDTAELYPTTPQSPETQGDTERFIGSWLKKTGKRDQIVLATKVAGKGVRHIRDGAFISPEEIDRALEMSLQRLGTDHVDLYQLHWPNRGTYAFRNNWGYDPSNQDTQKEIDSLHAILERLNVHRKAGKIREIGTSNDSAWGIMTMLQMAREHGLPMLQSVQNEYNLLDRKFDTDLAEIAHHTKVGLLAYTPLSAGILTGKYSDGAVPAGSRASFNKDLGGRLSRDYWKEPTAAYIQIAKDEGLPPEQLALAFCLSRPFMTSVIIGATSVAQLKSNIASSEVSLSESALERIAEIHRRYPAPY